MRPFSLELMSLASAAVSTPTHCIGISAWRGAATLAIGLLLPLFAGAQPSSASTAAISFGESALGPTAAQLQGSYAGAMSCGGLPFVFTLSLDAVVGGRPFSGSLVQQATGAAASRQARGPVAMAVNGIYDSARSMLTIRGGGG